MPRGRPRIEINWRLVDDYCAVQATQKEICAKLGISTDTMGRACQRKHKMSFADYFEEKRQTGLLSLRRRQFAMAMGDPERGVAPNATMMIWLGKNWLGQKDRHQIGAEPKTLDRLQELANAVMGIDTD